MRKPPFNDKRVRMAFTYLFNREALMEKLFHNEYDYTNSFFPGRDWGSGDENEQSEYDPDFAQELLAEAGYKTRNADGYLVGPDPGGGFLHGCCFGARHGLFLFDTEHQHAVVAAALDFGHGAQRSHRRGSTCGFVTHCGDAPQLRNDGRWHGAEMALPCVELAERIADVDGVDIREVDLGIGNGRQHRVLYE